MEDLFTIIVFVVVALVQGLAVKKKADKNRPARQKRSPRAASSPQKKQHPVFWSEQSENPPPSPEQWLQEIMEQEKVSRKQQEKAPKPSADSEYRSVAPASETDTPAMPEKIFDREEQVRSSGQVVEKSIEAALPNAVKTAKTMTAPRMHPVRVSTKNLRQAVIMSEVLARPRAFDL